MVYLWGSLLLKWSLLLTQSLWGMACLACLQDFNHCYVKQKKQASKWWNNTFPQMSPLNSVIEISVFKRIIRNCMYKRPGCYHSASKTQVRDRIFKLTPTHTSMIYQIRWITWISFPFRKNSIIGHHKQRVLVDPRGPQGHTPKSKFSHFHAVFRQKIDQNNRLAPPPLGLVPSRLGNHGIINNDRPFGCPIIYTDIISQYYFVHWHLQQCITQVTSFAN